MRLLDLLWWFFDLDKSSDRISRPASPSVEPQLSDTEEEAFEPEDLEEMEDFYD